MQIALLTCQKLPNLLETENQLIPKLAKHNIVAKAVIWNDETINWEDYHVLIFRNTWDYYEKQIEFDNWLDKIQKLGIKTLNSIAIINKNKHKFYLRELQQLGFTILPTIFIEKTKELNLKKFIPNHWKKAVIKPAYSAGSYQTELFDISEIDIINQKYQNIAPQKELLLQEFMPEIQTLGETSFIFFNKKFSHAVNKKPIEGEFRIQVQYGGKYKLVQPNQDIIEKAQKIVNTFSEDLLYARVDGIIIGNEIYLMEIECIEPDLYFNLAENSIDKFINSILELIKNPELKIKNSETIT
ncbi:RimK family alpha-L-glutamate ligase [Flavobacterium sp.]|uniref:ATP-grasp domain-containing protein n=1 Tax=Flavobacterium sp. TaxID=239 RepID=UPI00375247EA